MSGSRSSNRSVGIGVVERAGAGVKVRSQAI